MIPALIACLGGLGLFLFGMLVMTGGLRALAGPAQRRAIERFTRSPTTGALTGATLTAVLQSSSATTLAAVGFVGAGLLTFPQALGLILGANVGTTATGWLVALIGFKWDIATAASPLLFVGVVLKLIAHDRPGRLGASGEAAIGFALIFLGIQTLQHAMAGFGGNLLPEQLAGGGLGARLLLVGLGALVTIVTQSSSAGVATALAALDSGGIEFGEAAALVIGMDVGTTATAGLATIGGTVAMRRTGLAHVIFNLMTGLGALLFLPVFTRAAQAWRPGILGSDPELSLVGFHTAFNVLGVLLALPFANSLARLMERLVPDREGAHQLEPSLLAEPALALRAATRTGLSVFAAELFAGAARLRAEPDTSQPHTRPATELPTPGALRSFVFQLATRSPDPRDDRQIAALMHLVDHLARLSARRSSALVARTDLHDTRLAQAARELAIELSRAPQPVDSPESLELAERLRAAAASFKRRSQELADGLHASRMRVLDQAARGDLDLDRAERQLDGQRWLSRVAHHLWRASHHAANALQPTDVPSADEVDDIHDIAPVGIETEP